MGTVSASFQLKDAVDYTHNLGISLKGDLPIGIYRYSVEAWTEPEFSEWIFRQEHHRISLQNWGKTGNSYL
jgi:4-alpha-glucanotransferase